MDQQNLISVIVAIYNVDEYLDKCISSIVSQTYSDIEIILVDDGSTDTSGEICERWSKQDGRIVVIHQENKGLVECRKTGLVHAKGNFVVFVDGDDYVSLNMYEKLLDAMLRSGADIVNCGYYLGEERIGVPELKISITDDNRDDLLIKHVFDLKSESRIYSSIWSKMFRVESIRKAYSKVPFDCSIGEDLLALVYCFEQDIVFCSINEQYYHYVQRQNSLMNHTDHGYFVRHMPYLYHLERDIGSQLSNRKFEESVRKFIRHSLMAAIRRSSDDPYAVRMYRINDIDKLIGKKVVVYGAGDFGKDYYSQLMMHPGCNVVAWVDRNAKKLRDYLPVAEPQSISGLDYDYVILATGSTMLSENMRNDLIDMGVSESKIIFCDYCEED